MVTLELHYRYILITQTTRAVLPHKLSVDAIYQKNRLCLTFVVVRGIIGEISGYNIVTLSAT